MKKLFALTTIASIALTSTAFATTFDVTLDVQNSSSELVVTEISPVTFPVINVNNSTPAGSRCYTSYSGSEVYNRLCRNTSAESGSRKSGKFRIAGNGYTQVNLSISDSISQNGLKFTPSLTGASTTVAYSEKLLSIPSSNYIDFVVWGHLELLDASEVTTEQTVMTFDITATYQ